MLGFTSRDYDNQFIYVMNYPKKLWGIRLYKCSLQTLPKGVFYNDYAFGDNSHSVKLHTYNDVIEYAIGLLDGKNS